MKVEITPPKVQVIEESKIVLTLTKEEAGYLASIFGKIAGQEHPALPHEKLHEVLINFSCGEGDSTIYRHNYQDKYYGQITSKYTKQS